MSSQAMEYLMIPRWLWGLPAPIWLMEVDRIRSMVEEFKLKAVDEAHLPVHGVGFVAAASEAEQPPAWLRPRPFPGGLRIPHVHLDGRTYLVGADQWREFAGSVMKVMHRRLEHAQAVGVQQLTELSEVMAGL